MKINTITGLIIGALILTSCSSPSPDVSAPAMKGAAAVKPYPLKTCIVTDEALDSMGGAITKVYDGQEVKFCCKGCVKDFEASPQEFLAKLK